MSRQVDLTKPLSDEDREYLLSRGQNILVERLDLQFADDDEEAPAKNDPPANTGDSPAPAEKPDYTQMKNEELAALLEDLGLTKTGNKDELIARLQEHDAAS